MSRSFILLLLFFVASVDAEIKHRLLITDDAGHQLVHIDENDPSNNWAVPLEGKAWDVQIVGNHQATVTTETGYHLIDLRTGTLIKTIEVNGVPGIKSIRRLPDGTAIAIGSVKKTGALHVAVLDKDDHIVKKVEIDKVAKQLRFGRITQQGNLLITPNDELIELDLAGKVLNRFSLPIDKPANAKKLGAFMALKDGDSHYWVACGYAGATLVLDHAGKLLKCYKGPEGAHFFGGFQRLENGNLLQSNWWGHHPEAAAEGPQLFEFNPQGEVIWTFHDPEVLKCPVGVIVLDHLDAGRTAVDTDSVLKSSPPAHLSPQK
ncbi:hypothetical protein [Pontiella sulfatireligans]|uniref:Uncharacterized protein n=1 Tax=Pontiella sulfatireligans TaxID=2750658 RepID=A0A6C2UEK7_9BACT|nr:hypothetical protein [Pontiella sulfatireligans]VGO18548.1 hypothetical protein SCARR_00601 [Pontiella sulfatireligans]